MVLLYFVNESRTGRAWRALREDPLAAEVMSMPINRLKLMAFVFGAATAGLAGRIYGAVQTGAFPGDFDVGLLITIYAIVILAAPAASRASSWQPSSSMPSPSSCATRIRPSGCSTSGSAS